MYNTHLIITEITSISLIGRNSSTLIIEWATPTSMEGGIQHYNVRVTLHASGEQVTEENVTSTTFTASNLSEFVNLIEVTTIFLSQTSIGPGIAYDVSVSAMNFAGFGGSKNIPYFAKELGMCDQYSATYSYCRVI